MAHLEEGLRYLRGCRICALCANGVYVSKAVNADVRFYQMAKRSGRKSFTFEEAEEMLSATRR